MTSAPPLKKQKIFSPEENNVQSIHNFNDHINCTNGMNANGEIADIDENLYSRQLYVYGTDAMRRMAKTDILLIGLDGLGAEIAKNIILSGVKSITLYDNSPVELTDLSSHFFVGEADVGHPRAPTCRNKLAELNNYVSVHVLTKAKLDVDDYKKFNMVVLAQASEDACVECGDICRDLGLKFITASTSGLFGKIFCDFGPKYVVQDKTGLDAPTVMIGHIDQSKEGMVMCLDESFHSFDTGDYVTFSEIKGMSELNGISRQVKANGPHSFSIGDTSGFSTYISGGICTQVKMPVEITFDSYKTGFRSPQFMTTDFVKFDRSPQLHILFKALSEYKKKHGSLPKPWNEADASTLLKFAESVNSDLKGTNAFVDKVDEKLGSVFAHICAGQCSPIQSVIGSFAAQEVMKACTGKFMPLRQWAYFDATECLKLETPMIDKLCLLSENDTKPIGSRYDGQAVIFGHEFQKKLNELKYFIVGAGAIGCELLKNFALMGVGAGPNGKVTITDMDSIERSNLNRQFLFRSWDIHKLKSVVAGAAVKAVNPELNIVAHENRVCPETENIYDDDFFESLDGVANALDNVEARMYVDRRCVYYRKSLLESGTLGTKGNVQVVIPYLTESYSASRDPPEKSIPVCTLKNFPYQIEHTLQWARDLFEGMFVQSSATIAAFKQDPVDFMNRTLAGQGYQPLETLDTLKTDLLDKRPKSFDDCVAWARLSFQELFVNTISQLLFNFPPNHLTTSGTDFWSGYKRCPHPMEFDTNDPTHMDFIVSAANLRAHLFAVEECRNVQKVKDILKNVNVPSFQPKAGVRIDVTESEAQSGFGQTCDVKRLEELRKILTSSTELTKINTNIIEFEKDDDANFHMDFITAASNLRASNYSIPPADRLKSKLIAGKIIPAIATTTSLIGGLVCLELYKLVQGHKTVEFYKNAYLDLSEPFMSFFEPLPPAKAKYYDIEFSLWDRFELSGEMTLQDFVKYFEKLDLKVTMLSQDVSLIYAPFMGSEKCKERLKMSLRDLVEKVQKHKIPPHVKALVLDICCNDKDNQSIEVPYVRYELPLKSN